MLYFLSMHKKTLKKNDSKENTYLIQVHIFFILSRSSFIPTSIFRKNFFFIIFNMTFFLSTPFIPDMSVFFCQFSITQKYIFFWRKRIRHSFFQFFSSFIQNKTLPYFEKETEWETIFFCIFFKKFKIHFFVLTRVKFFNFNGVRKFNTTKTGKYFFKNLFFFRKP